MTGYARVLELDAEERERVEAAVIAWIKEDAPLAAKMSLLPAHVEKLISRIMGEYKSRL